MERILKTDVIIQASTQVRGYFVSYPTVITSFIDERGTTSTNTQRINEAHIHHFSGVRIQYLTDNSRMISPTVVLNYDPVKKIHATFVAE